MAFELTWDDLGERLYETGVSRVVIYPIKDTITDQDDPYGPGDAWSGITAINQSSSGGEPSPMWADDIKYLNLISAEEAQLSIEAYCYPDGFAECNGEREPAEGVTIYQQPRKSFGLTWRSRIGNDQKQTDYGYKLHLAYGCLAAPSDRNYQTINDSPEANTMSWSVSTTPVDIPGFKPTAILTINSLKTTVAKLTALEQVLYGTAAGSGNSAAVNARLPLPAEVVQMMS